MINNRHCARCARLDRTAWKPEEEFPRDKSRASGRARYCKLCCRELSVAYRAEHPGETEAQRQWRVDNIERERQNDRNYYARNKPRIRAAENERRRKKKQS